MVLNLNLSTCTMCDIAPLMRCPYFMSHKWFNLINLVKSRIAVYSCTTQLSTLTPLQFVIDTILFNGIHIFQIFPHQPIDSWHVFCCDHNLFSHDPLQYCLLIYYREIECRSLLTCDCMSVVTISGVSSPTHNDITSMSINTRTTIKPTSFLYLNI